MSHPGMLNVFSDNVSGKFEWSKENFEKINKIIKKYPSGKQQSAVLPVLDIAQRQNNGYLNKQCIKSLFVTLGASPFGGIHFPKYCVLCLCCRNLLLFLEVPL